MNPFQDADRLPIRENDPAKIRRLNGVPSILHRLPTWLFLDQWGEKLHD
jgi:hypothetical protein